MHSMQKLFSWPIYPHILSQQWGVHRPEIYLQFGFTDHNGQDHALGDAKIYAPCEATVLDVFNQPVGGGNVVSLLTEPIWFDAFTCTTPDTRQVKFPSGNFRVRIDFLHLDHALVKIGDKVKVGDLIAIGDNTGFSTGSHTHIQWRRVLSDSNNTHGDTNDANNSFDPTQFYDGVYAKDYQTYIQKAQALIALLKALVGVFSVKK